MSPLGLALTPGASPAGRGVTGATSLPPLTGQGQDEVTDVSGGYKNHREDDDGRR